MTKPRYDSEEELNDVVSKLGKLFDVARLVDPIVTTVNDPHSDECETCFDVWSKDTRCKNYTSSRVLVTGEPAHKYECIGDDIFLITSERVESPKGACILELVSRMEKRYTKYYREQQQDLTRLEELSVLALHDPLTGVFNRHFAEEKLSDVVANAKATNKDTLFAIVDVDNLKTANDTWGHLAGDALIRTVVSRILKVFPACGEDSGFVARIGGDEFIVVLNVENRQESDKLLGDIVNSVASTKIDAFPEVSVSVSVGGVLRSEIDHTAFVDFISYADMRLYDAKQSGRGRFVSEGNGIFEPPARKEGEKRKYRRG